MRAMREARYNRAKASTAVAPKPARPRISPEKPAETETAAPQPVTEGLCGHRSMNGRTCTREQGHAAKTHRYS